MVFSSPTFLFLFLPLVLLLHLVLGQRLCNVGLLIASLLFYAWGEGFLVAIMLMSIAANWGLGLWVAHARSRGGGRRAVIASVVFNLGLLVIFKYANWIWASLSTALDALGLMDGGLPLKYQRGRGPKVHVEPGRQRVHVLLQGLRLRFGPSPSVRAGAEPGPSGWVVHSVRVRTTPSSAPDPVDP